MSSDDKKREEENSAGAGSENQEPNRAVSQEAPVSAVHEKAAHAEGKKTDTPDLKTEEKLPSAPKPSETSDINNGGAASLDQAENAKPVERSGSASLVVPASTEADSMPGNSQEDTDPLLNEPAAANSSPPLPADESPVVKAPSQVEEQANEEKGVEAKEGAKPDPAISGSHVSLKPKIVSTEPSSSQRTSQPISPASMPGSASQSFGVQLSRSDASNAIPVPKVSPRQSLSGLPAVTPKAGQQQSSSGLSPAQSPASRQSLSGLPPVTSKPAQQQSLSGMPAATKPAQQQSARPAMSVPEPVQKQPPGGMPPQEPLSVAERVMAFRERPLDATLQTNALSKPIHPSLDETSTHIVIESVRNLLIAKEEFLGRDELLRASRELARVVPYNFEAWRLHADLLISALHQLETRQIQPDDTLRLLTVPLREADLRDAAEAALRECAHYASSTEQRIALVDEANRVRRRTWL